MNRLFNYFERFKKHKKRVSGMLEKMVKKHVESKIKGENQVAKGCICLRLPERHTLPSAPQCGRGWQKALPGRSG